MAKAHLESNSWRQKKEQMTDEKEKLVAHVDLLKRLVVSMWHTLLIVVQSRHQYACETSFDWWVVDLHLSEIADLTRRLQKEKDELTEANEATVQRIDKLKADNGDLRVSNATLKVGGAEQLACKSQRGCKNTSAV